MAMRIEAITTMHTLERLRQAWDAVYDSDGEAQFFLSWPWMSNRLRSLSTPWIVLAARAEADPAPCVAFLPLSIRTLRNGDGPQRELRTAGSPVADYTGFICRPEHEGPALAAFAEALRRLRQRLLWNRLNLAGLRTSERRLQPFLSAFARAGFELTGRRGDNGDGVDNAVCPYVALPGDWDGYLAAAVGASTRQRIRRFLRRIEGSRELSITEARPETIEADIEALLRMWQTQWAERKQGGAERIRVQTSAMLMRCFEDGSLFLPTLRWNGTPVGALAILVDPVKRSYLFYIGGRDPSFTSLPPGFCLHAFAIRHAIERGFATYDFLRGDEPYKFLFGAQRHPIRTIIVRARTERMAGIAHAPSTAALGLDPK
ncbi:GNAT family N-acetyltransferase [Falsiroseomonas sp.]|uniref:GNAT family N-acetyltransferase n=1 Tax=Falsiroseomonas sp. TaxID=2870721 RepID=UPI00356501B5